MDYTHNPWIIAIIHRLWVVQCIVGRINVFCIALWQRSCTSLGVKPQDMTALSIDYVTTLTGGTPSSGRCHTNVNTIEKLCIVLLFFLFLLNKSNT